MNDTYISFYLRPHRIHVFADALRGIGSPEYICFMIDETGNSLVMSPYPHKDFKSHHVSKAVYSGSKSLEISSFGLCKIISQLQNWDPDYSYRIPGKVLTNQNIAVFSLSEATQIHSP